MSSLKQCHKCVNKCLTIMPMDIYLSNGTKNMPVRKCIQNLALSSKKILLSFMFRIQNSNEFEKKNPQPWKFQREGNKTPFDDRKRLQYTTPLDCKKFWATRYL